MRLFIAVDMSLKVQEHVRELQAFLKKTALFKGTYTDWRSVHVTLKFLGDVDEEHVQELDAALKSIKFEPMRARLGRLDVFGAGEKVKIIFLSLVCPELSELAQQIDGALSEWFEPEARLFVPHLTLARVKSVEDNSRLLHEINQYEVEPISFTIDQFVLKQSVLAADGPLYTDVAYYSSLDNKA